MLSQGPSPCTEVSKVKLESYFLALEGAETTNKTSNSRKYTCSIKKENDLDNKFRNSDKILPHDYDPLISLTRDSS